MFKQYLWTGVRLGYRDAATAYFLGFSRRPVNSDDAQTALATYIAGNTVFSTDSQPAWQWAGTGTRVATATFSARDGLTAVRVEVTPGATWRGTVVAEQQVNGVWMPAGRTYAGAAPFAGTRQTILVPLAATDGVAGMRLTFMPVDGGAQISADRMIMDNVWSTGTASITTGAPYTVSTSPRPAGTYADTVDTVNKFGRGLLTDGSWSTTGWWNARPLGWWDTPPVRIVFDLGATKAVDKIVLHTHDATDASVNWPWAPAVHLADNNPVLAGSQRGADDTCPIITTASACRVTTLTGTAPTVVSANGADRRAYDGTITFAPAVATSARYATLVVQPTGWFLADEVRFFSGGVDITGSVSYRTLTAPNPQSVDTSNYPDNGARLTDGNVAPLTSGPAVTAWRAGNGSTVTVDLTRTATVDTATSWFIHNTSWGVHRPASVTVATSTDGATWTTLGQTTTISRTWKESVALTATGSPRSARFIRYTIPADPTKPTAWNMISEAEAGRS
jgi:hypothetical protein